MGEDLVIVGDLNVCLDPLLDRYNHVSAEVRNAGFQRELLAFLDSFSLCDVGRMRNRNRKMFTWLRGTKASRLDYIFISEFLSGFGRNTIVMMPLFLIIEFSVYLWVRNQSKGDQGSGN